jgi:hypothetical protein
MGIALRVAAVFGAWVVARALVLKGVRGEAADTAVALLRRLDRAAGAVAVAKPVTRSHNRGRR